MELTHEAEADGADRVEMIDLAPPLPKELRSAAKMESSTGSDQNITHPDRETAQHTSHTPHILSRSHSRISAIISPRYASQLDDVEATLDRSASRGISHLDRGLDERLDEGQGGIRRKEGGGGEERTTTDEAQGAGVTATAVAGYDYLVNTSALFKAIFLTTTCATQLIAQAQFGMLIIPIHDIGRWLGTDDSGQMSWMAASYGLTVGITVIVSGRVGDLYGPKLVWTIGIIVVIISNLGSGFCKSPIPFDICRAISGIGAALSLPNALAILGRTYPPGTMRHIVFAILGALAPAGFWLGGAIAAIFAELATVPWIWWFTTIFSTVFLGVGLLVLPPDDTTQSDSSPGVSKSKSREFDYLGAVLLVVALSLFNFVWNQASLVSWSTQYVYILLIVSVLAFVAFYWWEKRMGKSALIPLEVLSRQSLLVYLTLWLGWMSLGIFLLYTSSFIYEIRGYHNSLTIAAQMFPLMPGGCAAALAVPFLITRYPGHLIFLAAMISYLIGSILAATTPAHGIYWGNTFWSMILIISGPDLSFSTGQLIVSNSVDREFQGIAAGIVSMITNYSISIGLGMAGTVERYIRLSAQHAGHSDYILRGYRAAFYLAIGFSTLAVAVVALFVRMPKQKNH